MAEGADCGSANPAKRKQPAGRKSRQSQGKRSSSSRVCLEKVLGISTASSSGLTSDPNTGLIAYPAGCVVVLLHPKKNKQSHIISASRKPFSALAFSHDGKHLVTGESGHMPCVRVWELDGGQVAEVQCHKYGISCVAFSTNSSYIVSVGYQHDMTVSVWDWKKGSIIASNKVSSRVFAVSFSQDSSYFVTAGNRHVKFWYLDASKERRVNSTVPLIGRSGLLGDHKNSVFCGVACGRGRTASNTYCITSSGLLCLFNSSRHLEAWVNLKTSSASCLAVSESFVFCGCADGVVRVFGPSNLQYVTTLHRPHRLGVDLAQSGSLLPASPGAQYPDTLALTFDPAARHLTCVYNDHSLYVWDVKDVRNARKLYSALYHSGCVWSVEVYPELPEPACLPPSSFLTCSSDNTIRLWHSDPPGAHTNLYSNDLLRILYMGENTQHLQAEGEAAGADGKAGIKVLCISPDGRHLAAGDRCGNLRIFGLQFLDELVKIEAHDSEVLCLEFSPVSTGVKLLASASRDRLIHVFDLERNYSLEQTLNDHSASITAVKFTGESPEVRLVSCGADKSIYFQTAEQTSEGLQFSRSHHVVEKTTLYDMDLDSSRTHVAVACQDRNVRVYNVETGKLKKCLKGSSSDEGALLKVQMDPSGSFFATSCSDKNITIFDYESGECVATLFGHSELVTCIRFSQDCRHLITVSGDSCVFVWRLDAQMTSTMRKRRGVRLTAAPETHKKPNIRRETFITVPSSQLPQMEEEEERRTPCRLDPCPDAPLLQTNGKLPLWFKKLQGQGGASSTIQSESEPRQVRSRWAEQMNPLTFCSNFSPSPNKSQGEEDEEEEEEEGFHPQSLERLLEDEEEEVLQTAGGEQNTFILYPSNTTVTPESEFEVEGVPVPQQSLSQLEVRGQGEEPVWRTQLSPDSACSEGSAGSLEQQHDPDTDSLSQGSSVGSLGLEDDEDRNSLKNHFETLASGLSEEKFDTDLKTLQPPDEKHFLNPRLSISTRFLSRFQDRIRASRAPPPVSIPTRISEESNVSTTSVNSESSSDVSSAGLTGGENGGGAAGGGASCRQSALHRRASCKISHQPHRHGTPRRRNTALVVLCRKTLGDVTSRTITAQNSCREEAADQPSAFRLRYLGTTASSRAKLSRDPPGSTSSPSSTPTLEENKENLPSPADCQPPASTLLSARQDSKPDNHQDQTSSLQVWTTPTQVISQLIVDRCNISSTEEALIQTPVATPTTCEVVTCPASTKEEAGRPADPDVSLSADLLLSAPPTSSSSPLVERLRPTLTGSGGDEESVSVQCLQIAAELRATARRAVHLYQKLGATLAGSQRRLQVSSAMLEAFDVVRADMQEVLRESGGSVPCGQLEDRRTASLLETYSERLLQMVEEKMKRV
ncbi:WD repeat-containing protein 62 isoform X1 [Simochromis diagramma]|uniref:WD repeat-containing protein 62 isoform X1 n=1 Tax=Simochromis diagramma TaxID=43689 RepID=UPI001A7E9026|nr:WD repeat-containing protein 62 isoform X1 [Simochromis diagramma]